MIHLDFNSPEEEIHHPLFLEKNIRVYLKRDDLIHPFISGNKWRKLKYPLRKAQAEQKERLITFGGVWSNHLLATACAAAKFGFRSKAFVRGEDINTDVTALCRLWGMELIFVDRESYRDKQKLFDDNFKNNKDSFFIDEGGAGPEAARGCAELIDELQNEFEHIFCACGTGTTAAGIINGLGKANSPAVFHAVSALKGDFLKSDINKLLIEPIHYEFHSDYHFGGYAKTQPKLIQFISEFASSTSILLDPVYTGKMMFSIFDLAKKDYFKSGSRILAIHTGGLFGLLGMFRR